MLKTWLVILFVLSLSLSSLAQDLNFQKQKTEITYPNLKLFPVTLIAAGLCVELQRDISDLNARIRNPNYMGLSKHELEVTRTHKKIVFWTIAAAGILNTYITFKKVKVSAAPNRLKLSVSW